MNIRKPPEFFIKKNDRENYTISMFRHDALIASDEQKEIPPLLLNFYIAKMLLEQYYREYMS